MPGHTLSHIPVLGDGALFFGGTPFSAGWRPMFGGHGALFCGDTLFSAGCGRMFEGTPRQMNDSLTKLRNLPPETRMFCGHEYTAANLRFAVTVDPANAAALDYQGRVERVRAAGNPTLPSTLDLEIRVNPFLRCDVPTVVSPAEIHAGKSLKNPAEVFGVLRAWKDQFR